MVECRRGLYILAVIYYGSQLHARAKTLARPAGIKSEDFLVKIIEEKKKVFGLLEKIRVEVWTELPVSVLRGKNWRDLIKRMRLSLSVNEEDGF